jgi:hypothetical protein
VPRRVHDVAGGIDVDRARERQVTAFSSSAMKDHRTAFDASGNRLRIGHVTLDDVYGKTGERCCPQDAANEHTNLGAAFEHQPLNEPATEES